MEGNLAASRFLRGSRVPRCGFPAQLAYVSRFESEKPVRIATYALPPFFHQECSMGLPTKVPYIFPPFFLPNFPPNFER